MCTHRIWMWGTSGRKWALGAGQVPQGYPKRCAQPSIWEATPEHRWASCSKGKRSRGNGIRGEEGPGRLVVEAEQGPTSTGVNTLGRSEEDSKVATQPMMQGVKTWSPGVRHQSRAHQQSLCSKSHLTLRPHLFTFSLLQPNWRLPSLPAHWLPPTTGLLHMLFPNLEHYSGHSLPR